jgi:hypothetical protein
MRSAAAATLRSHGDRCVRSAAATTLRSHGDRYVLVVGFLGEEIGKLCFHESPFQFGFVPKNTKE